MKRHSRQSFLVTFAFALTAICAQITGHTQSGDSRELPGLDRLPVITELPDPFLMNDGARVKSRADWAKRREQIEAMLLYYEYGHLAPAPKNLTATELSSQRIEDLDATERRLLLALGPGEALAFHLVLTIPSGKGPFPAVVKGDLCWGRIAPSMIAAAVRRGYLVAEFDRTELAPDSADRTKGVFPVYPGYDWTVLGAWAWGFHRTADYLTTQSFVDPRRIAITGHSRGGKAALLAGALDERIALTVPNGSG